MRISLLLLCFLFLSSCASYFKRQACESTDWYQHGYKHAMTGQRLDSDSFVKECKAAESEMDYAALDKGFKAGMAGYCKPEVAKQKGYQGDSYNYDFCDSNLMAKLRGSFEMGRDKLCSSGGFQFGAKGNEYKAQCTSRNEMAFLKEYKRGRHKYLKSEIQLSKTEIYSIDRKIRSLEYEIMSLRNQEMALGSGQVMVREKKYDEFNNAYTEQVRMENNPDVQNKKYRLQNQISTKRSEVNSLKSKQSDLENRIRKLQRDLATMDI